MLTLPAISAYDPGYSLAGGLDPLGFTALYDTAAGQMVPGMTNRLRVPRYLTLCALSALVLDDVCAELGAGKTPAHPELCLEWVIVQLFARANLAQRSTDSDSDLSTAIPGINKVSNVLRLGQQVNTKNYLHTASVFGYHGIHKPITRALAINSADATLRSSRNTRVVVEAWESSTGFQGFANESGGRGTDLRRALARLTVRAVTDGGIHLTQRESELGAFVGFVAAVQPVPPTGAERDVLRQLFTTPPATGSPSPGQVMRRNELARLLASVSPDDVVAEDNGALAETVLGRASDDVAHILRAFLALDAFSAPYETAFNHMLVACTVARAGHGGRTLDDLANEELIAEAIPDLEDRRAAWLSLCETSTRADAVDRSSRLTIDQTMSIEGARDALDARGGELLRDVVEAPDTRACLRAIIVLHGAVQGARLPSPKRPWLFEADGRYLTEPANALKTEPPRRVEDLQGRRSTRLGTLRRFAQHLAIDAAP